jgi:chaperonin GroEL
MKKTILLGQEGKEKLLQGVNTLADAVKVTLGANGRNVLIASKYGHIRTTKDGVSVASEVHLDDPIMNAGATMMKEISSRTVKEAGDGTTTSIVLAQALISDGLAAVRNGHNPVLLKKEMQQACAETVSELKELAVKVDSYEKMVDIATISANNDKEIGKLIADAFNAVGESGIVNVEIGNTPETTTEVTSGMRLHGGYASPYFATDATTLKCEMINPQILVVDGVLSNVGDVINIIEHCAKSNEPLILLANDVTGELLSTLILNRLKNNLNVCAAKMGGYGASKSDIFEDASIFTGANLVSDIKGIKVSDINISYLGTCSKAVISKDSIVFVGNGGCAIDERVTTLKSQMSSAKQYEVDSLKMRIASLTGGAAVIKVGGITDIEAGELKDRVDDAVCATRSAIEEGYVAGGGAALQWLFTNKSETIGHRLFMRAITAPMKQIMENSGITKYDLPTEYGQGINAITGEKCNMILEGIIDPVKVVRVALENAVSVASNFILTECVIVETE